MEASQLQETLSQDGLTRCLLPVATGSQKLPCLVLKRWATGESLPRVFAVGWGPRVWSQERQPQGPSALLYLTALFSASTVGPLFTG